MTNNSFLTICYLFQMTLSHGKSCKQVQYSDVSTTNTSKKQKEPRFVPYEPYKAAVNPMVFQKLKSKPKLERNDSNTKCIENKVEESNDMKNEIVNAELSNASEIRDSNENITVTEIKVNTTEIGESLATELDNTKKLLAEASKKLEESEKQLQIQIQV